MSIGAQVQDHYGMFAQRQAILDGLAQAGKNIDVLSMDDIAPFDHLHTSGRVATAQLITALGAQAGERVLDVGCGIGGPARVLATTTGCHVTGVDLTPGFIATAEDFSRRCGLSNVTRFMVGSATALPVEDASFDRAWHIHMSMNVPDKAAMYREIARALKPGGRFALYDPLRGVGPAVRYPVPWSKTGETSFLVPRADMLALITAAGLRLIDEHDHTADGVAWIAETQRQRDAAPATATPPAIRDPIFQEMSANHRANMESGAVMIWRAVFEKV